MLIAAALCPPAPLLLPGVEGRLAEDEGPPPSPDRPLGTWRYGGHAPHGQSGVALPLSFAVGMSLLTEAGFTGEVRLLPLPAATTPERAAQLGRDIVADGDVGLLLIGNASACSPPRAPGAFREDAEEFNEAIVHAVRTLEPASLMGVSDAAAREQLSDLRLPLQVLSGALEGAVFVSDGRGDRPGPHRRVS